LNFLVFIQPCEVFGRTNCCHHKWLAHRRLAERFELHAIARLIQFFKVMNHLAPTGELAIVVGDEAENFLWSGYRLRRDPGVSRDCSDPRLNEWGEIKRQHTESCNQQ